jgi:formylglycine-generating enzyme required for sulfatase activity
MRRRAPLAAVLVGLAGLSGGAGLESYTETIPGTKVSFEMAAIPAGEVLLGSPPGEPDRGKDEGPQVRASVGAFWIGRHEVTWNEYDLFAFDKRAERDAQDAAVATPPGIDAVTRPTPPYADESFGYGKGRQPALSMTHHAAMEYTRWLSQKTGHAYRLPTEAEWEYACRAGERGRFGSADDEGGLAELGWSRANSDDRPRPSGRKKPNAFGLLDMNGNLAEWTLDRYEKDAYAGWAARKGVVANPVMLPDERRYANTVRGGSWDDPPAALRCAARRASEPGWNRRDPQRPQSIWWLTDATHVGFRVVRALAEPKELVGLRSKVTRESP